MRAAKDGGQQNSGASSAAAERLMLRGFMGAFRAATRIGDDTAGDVSCSPLYQFAVPTPNERSNRLAPGEARGEHEERVVAIPTLSLCRLLCRKQKIKRVDEVCRLRVGLRVGLSGCALRLLLALSRLSYFTILLHLRTRHIHSRLSLALLASWRFNLFRGRGRAITHSAHSSCAPVASRLHERMLFVLTFHMGECKMIQSTTRE